MRINCDFIKGISESDLDLGQDFLRSSDAMMAPVALR